MKALSFLGTGPRGGYQPTTYLKHDRQESYKTHLFPEAVFKLYTPEQITVFVTPIVKKDENGYLEYLEKELGSGLCIRDIPNGNSTEELWEIFNVCENAIEAEDEIILDITHAFRSLPLLIFSVSAYLRQVKNVKLKQIIYGAYEARNQDTNETPIFDLTPFVELLDWTNAVNVFQNSGDARPIAELGIQNDVANALTQLSNALLTNRTLEVQQAAFKFNGLKFDNPQALPFQMLIQQLKRNYQKMAVHNRHQLSKLNLTAQYQQIKWYIENQHYLQAVTLMREWLISWRCFTDNENWLNADSRKLAENALNALVNQEENPLARGLAQLTDQRTDIKIWKQCRDIRNDLAHCGMRYKPEDAANAIRSIETLFQEFEEFANNLQT